MIYNDILKTKGPISHEIALRNEYRDESVRK